MGKKKDNAFQKIKTDYYYDLFYKLYNEKTMIIGYMTWMNRINDRHYSWSSMKKLCIIIKWYLDNYDNANTRLEVNVHQNNRFMASIIQDNKVIDSFIFKKFNNCYMPIYDVLNDKPLELNIFKKYNIEQFDLCSIPFVEKYNYKFNKNIDYNERMDEEYEMNHPFAT